MKTNNVIPKSALILIKVLRAIFNFGWYLNLVLIPVVLIVIALGSYKVGNMSSDIDVQLKQTQVQQLATIHTQDGKTAQLSVNQGILQLQGQRTVPMYIAYLLGFALFQIQVILLLYNFRKILSNFKQQQPFLFDNIRRLKLIALALILYLPFDYITYLVNLWLVNTFVENFNEHYTVVQSFNFEPLILGLIVYVIACVFKYGAQIEQENKEFI